MPTKTTPKTYTLPDGTKLIRVEQNPGEVCKGCYFERTARCLRYVNILPHCINRTDDVRTDYIYKTA